jgi:hypothetical protein
MYPKVKKMKISVKGPTPGAALTLILAISLFYFICKASAAIGDEYCTDDAGNKSFRVSESVF